MTVRFLVAPVVFICLCISSCKEYHRNKSYAHVTTSSIKKGKVLAEKYCQSCHLFPDPSFADAKTWNDGILPSMGPRLGIFEYNFRDYPSSRNDKNLEGNMYPAKPLLSADDWQHVIDYFTATAPDSLPLQSRSQPIKEGLPFFNALIPPITATGPAVSFVKIDTSQNEHLLLYDLVTQAVYRFNNQLQLRDSLAIGGCIVNVEEGEGRLLTCNIGNINPNNGKYGRAQYLNMASGKMQLDTAVVLTNLERPVQITPADLNRDGRTDYVACEFGFVTGSLSWYENTGTNQFRKHVIKAVPGAIRAIVRDDNKDGLPDLWVLFAQGDEGISVFTNKGAGRFEEKQVLRFPPVYGSTYFEFADFNKDGYPDIVYTCGDNADYSQVLKPYHGIYIFLNDGKNNFRQKFFFPINGCYKAIARDFDVDGDLDIATISFFADYARQPEEGFVFLENRGAFNFQPYTVPESKQGRWLTMDAADLNGDGLIDLVLGNFSIGPKMMTSETDWKKGPAFIFLQNTISRQRKY